MFLLLKLSLVKWSVMNFHEVKWSEVKVKVKLQFLAPSSGTA